VHSWWSFLETSFVILSSFYYLKRVLNLFLQTMVTFEKLGIKANSHVWNVVHTSTPIEKENKIAWVWKWMDSKWNNKLTSLAPVQKNHNSLLIYLIDLKSLNKVASWSDVPYSICKKINKNKIKSLHIVKDVVKHHFIHLSRHLSIQSSIRPIMVYLLWWGR
jgi:hypothetical protein